MVRKHDDHVANGLVGGHPRLAFHGNAVGRSGSPIRRSETER